MDDLSPRHGGSVFAGLVGASQVLGLVSVVLTGVWMGHYRGGFAWDGSAHEFNLHPLCMVLGLIFLHGDGEKTQTCFTLVHTEYISFNMPSFDCIRRILRAS